MLRPAQLRPGQSRKAQNRLFVAYVVAIVGSVAALLLATLSFVDPVGFAALRSITQESVTPVARVTRSVTGTISGVDDSVAAYVSAGSQNQRLRKQVAEQQRELVAASTLAEENRQMRILLKLAEQGSGGIANGYLLTSNPTSSRRLAILSIGRNQGVQPGMPVRAADGLIGRVLDSSATTARVLLLTDSDNIVPLRRASDGLPALASGRGNGQLDIRTLNLANNPFKAGDILVTSGTGGIYRPNIPVAIVVRKESDGATARPLADPAKVDIVSVLPAYAAATTESEIAP
ncbi:MAG: rod shape-determining protein MreC [Sphingopyxis sp.]|nr:rod shape-determining protein MreC [Sphingopyxis sp.]